MPGSTAAKRYAKAILSLATEQGEEDIVGEELAQVVGVLSDPDLAKVLTLPTLPPKIRQDIVERLVTVASPRPLVANFLRVVAQNDRLGILPDIEGAYQLLLDRAKGRTRAAVRSAVPLSEDELNDLVGAFSRLTQKTVVPTVAVDETLLGGTVVEVEGRVYDASLKTQLQQLVKTLTANL